MLSVKAAIQMAQSRKVITGNPFSMQDLAQQLGMTAPISVHDLMLALDKLPPASVLFSSGPMTTGDVHGEAGLFLQSDGGSAFRGQVGEEGEIGDNFLLTVTLLDVTDESGKALVLVHSDTVVGKHLPGFSEKTWNTFGGIQEVADNWERVKTTRVNFNLFRSTDPFEVTEVAVTGLIVVVLAIVGGIKLAQQDPKCAQGRDWVGGWRVRGSKQTPSPGLGDDFTQRPNIDVGVDYVVTYEGD